MHGGGKSHIILNSYVEMAQVYLQNEAPYNEQVRNVKIQAFVWQKGPE